MFDARNISQFAVVHYFTKNGSGEMYFNDTSSSSDDSDDENENEVRTGVPSSGGGSVHNPHSFSSGNPGGSGGCSSGGIMMQQMAIIDIPPPPPVKINNVSGLGSGEDSPSVIPGCPQQHAQSRLGGDPQQHHRRDSAWNLCKKANKKRRDKLRLRHMMELENVNSVSKVDVFARIFFPLSFFCINVFYWYSYLYKSNDES